MNSSLVLVEGKPFKRHLDWVQTLCEIFGSKVDVPKEE